MPSTSVGNWERFISVGNWKKVHQRRELEKIHQRRELEKPISVGTWPKTTGTMGLQAPSQLKQLELIDIGTRPCEGPWPPGHTARRPPRTNSIPLTIPRKRPSFWSCPASCCWVFLPCKKHTMVQIVAYTQYTEESALRR
jgi:hypothetical protein